VAIMDEGRQGKLPSLIGRVHRCPSRVVGTIAGAEQVSAYSKLVGNLGEMEGRFLSAPQKNALVRRLRFRGGTGEIYQLLSISR
jgi:hypothetical protein